jgi:hypothetical protein
MYGALIEMGMVEANGRDGQTSGTAEMARIGSLFAPMGVVDSG